MLAPVTRLSVAVIRAWSAHRRALSWLSLAAVIEAVLSTLGIVVLVRTAGLDATGMVVLAQSFAALVFVVLDPRLEDSLQRYVPLVARNHLLAVRSVVWRLVRVDMLVGIGSALLLTLAVSMLPLPRWLGVDAVYLLLASIAMGLAAAQGTLGACFAVTNRLTELAKLRCAGFGVVAVAACTAAVVSGPVAYLAVLAVGQSVVTGLLIFRGRRHVRAAWPGDERTRLPSGFLRFTVLSSAATSAALGSESALVTVAGALGGPPVAAGLKIATAPARLLFTAVSPLWAVMFPRIARHVAAGEVWRVRTVCLQSSALMLAAALPVLAVSVLALPTLLLWVYGTAASMLGWSAVVAVGVHVLKIVSGWSKVMPLAVGRPGWKLGMTTAEGVVLVAALLVVIPTLNAGTAETVLAVLVSQLAVAVAITCGWLVLVSRLIPREVKG